MKSCQFNKVELLVGKLIHDLSSLQTPTAKSKDHPLCSNGFGVDFCGPNTSSSLVFGKLGHLENNLNNKNQVGYTGYLYCDVHGT